ncbi:LysR family transcriptional regulator [Culicoidibacter larvae]|nr:LysR family transcriptional regulator [Culicoidibacter larvae]
MERKWQVYIAVVEHKSFTKAADALFMSQPAVSVVIANIEEELHAKLINRENRQFSLTETGYEVYKKAKQLEHIYDELQLVVDEHYYRSKERVTIGATKTISDIWLFPFVREITQAYSDMEIKVASDNTSAIIKMLLEYKLDCALVEGDIRSVAVNSEVFAMERLHLYVPDNDVSKPWIVREPGSGTRALVEAYWKENKVKPAKIYETGSNYAIKSAVENGVAIGFVAEGFAVQGYESQATLTRPLYFVTRKGEKRTVMSERVATFLQSRKD